MNSQYRIMILGANSFSGSFLTKFLLENTFEVTAVNRSSQVSIPYRPYSAEGGDASFQIFELGSNYDPKDVVDICNEKGINVIFNFAAQSMVAQSWETPWDWYETNCVWLSRLIHELTKWGRLHKFIHFSTPEVYGSTSGWIDEKNVFNPSTPYAISRAAGDLHLIGEFKKSEFPVILTRASNVFGPHQQRYRIIPKALIAAATNEKLELHGGGLSKRSFIYIEDVAQALFKILSHGIIGETYHISTDRLVSIRDVVELCFESYGKKLNDYLTVSADRPGKDQAYMLDSSKLRGTLGWKDGVSLEIGIEYTRRWVDESLELLLKEPSEYVHKA